MSDSESPRPALDRSRAALARARAARERLAVELARSAAAWRHAVRAHGRDHERTRKAEAEHAARTKHLKAARAEEHAAKRALGEALSASLAPDPADDVRALSAAYPIVLLPARLETRFDTRGPRPELKVRIYPDEIVADTHEPVLTQAEAEAGCAYWLRAWDPSQEATAWQELVTGFPAPRAAWIVQATTPTNVASRPSGEPNCPPVEVRSGSWTRAAEANVLPDRWVVLAYRNGQEVYRVPGRPVHEPLALTLSPSVDPEAPEDIVDISGDGLHVSADAAWTFDFARAEEAGMALRIPLQPPDVEEGFDQLIAVGVKSSLTPEEGSARLAALLDGHHYTRGVAFVRQGTPTNNSRAAPSGYPPPDPGGATSFAVERRGALNRDGSDGLLFTRALGVSPTVAAHIESAGRTEQQAARAMNDALWPVTFGYFLEQMMAPVFTKDAIRETRRHFVGFVRGRGPLPAFRVGGTPYGLMPVSSLSGWQPRAGATGVDRHLPGALQTLRGIWVPQIAQVPRIGRTPDDPDGDLLAVLGMEASAREIRMRTVLGPDFQWNLFRFSGIPWEVWWTRLQTIARDALALIGHPEWNPRIAGMTFTAAAALVRQPFVAPLPLSETEGLKARLGFDYIRWIRTTSSIESLKREIMPKGLERPTALLYHLLRHAALVEYARTALDVQVRHGLAREEDHREPELVGIIPGTTDRPTVWQRLGRPIPRVTGNTPLGEYLLTARESRDTAPVYSYRDSLQTLEGRPTAELERLLTETLDTASHRLDAWITSLATKRLGEMRETHPTGVHLGAYAWVENLRPAPPDRHRELTLGGRPVRVQNVSGGYVQAPSMNHAATAAILRNAYLTRGGGAGEPYAVDLSSARVRVGLRVLDAARQGQPPGAIFGYLVERALHDGQLDLYIERLRQRFPLVTKRGAEPDAAAEAIAARNVVDGLALRTAWRTKATPLDTPDRRVLDELHVQGDDREGFRAAMGVLDDAVDAVADLLIAESVYQIVRGGTGAAAASLDALAQGVRAPDPAVARAPRGGTMLTHRCAILLGTPALSVGAGWPPEPTPRARAEPFLDGWVGSLLGDPTTVRCRVSYGDPASADPTLRVERVVTLADLGLRPLDVLTLSQGGDPSPQASELDRWVEHAALGENPATDVRIRYARDPTWDRNTVRTFPELLELVRAIHAVIGGARPLRAADLLLPEAPDPGAPSEEADRTAGARTALREAVDALTAAVTAVEQVPEDIAVDLMPLREALRQASRLGVPGALPASRHGWSSGSRTELLAQAKSVLVSLDRRSAEADAATGAGGVIRAVFGREFMFLPRFRPTESDPLAQALAAGGTLVGGPDDVRKWLQQVARVRDPLRRWRILSLYATALGTPEAPLDVVQLPHAEGVRWAALPFSAGNPRPPSGRVSLVLQRPVAPAAHDTEWIGLLLDEWTEVIPSPEETTGIAFHYDDPGAEAAQAVLLAVPPTDATTWEFGMLVDILRETLELAKLRAVDGDLLGGLGQLLPAVYLAANAANETVATDFVAATFVTATAAPTGVP